MSEKIKSPERLVFFSDAVVAIALTLLVLPLTDFASSILSGSSSFAEVEKHQSLIWTFLLSFLVIGRYWLVHHQTFEQVKAYSRPLMLVNMAWLLTIVFLPFPTELVASTSSHDRFTLILYIGTLFVSSLLLGIMLVIIRDDPTVLREPGAISYRWEFDSLSVTVTLAICLATVAIFPAVSYYILLLNMVQPWFVRAWFWLRGRSASKVDA
ncbi:MAG TPA: TMEM175 family protein [Pseudonocardiaceae bacterium]|jgi:uncharacterized membrane protein|nr:TMEM175 family protein [Pseudonocardiaceae bacterium]